MFPQLPTLIPPGIGPGLLSGMMLSLCNNIHIQDSWQTTWLSTCPLAPNPTAYPYESLHNLHFLAILLCHAFAAVSNPVWQHYSYKAQEVSSADKINVYTYPCSYNRA